MSSIISLKEFYTLDKLLEYLQNFPLETKLCGIGGGPINITRYKDEPNTLWIE